MPIIDIKIIRGTLTDDQKRIMAQKVGDAAIAVEGEARRPLLMVGFTELAPQAIIAGKLVDLTSPSLPRPDEPAQQPGP